MPRSAACRALLFASLLLPVRLRAETPVPKPAAEEKKKSFAEVVAKSDRIDGLLRVWRDRENGKVHLALRKEQLDRDFVYSSQTVDSPVEGGSFRGEYSDGVIVRFHRNYDRVEVVIRNSAFWFDPASPLARAATANTSPAVVASAKVEAEDAAGGELLVEAEPIFLGENLRAVKPIPLPDDKEAAKRFQLGKLSTEKTKFASIRSWPKNCDFVVDYVFEEPRPIPPKGEEITDPRFVTVTIRHSLVEAPDEPFEPRFEDPRIGYFATRVTDLTSTKAAPYRDLVHRWKLVKKDPSAPLSEPVEPIVWWIENTTPLELRDTIRDAALEWNRPFEKIGFRNALVVKVQPDDADWDAGDIRYNVIRWTSTPNPVFGGYGPSFADPRTGRMLGADIMCEWSMVTWALRTGATFDRSLLAGLEAPAAAGPAACTAGAHAQAGLLFGATALAVAGAPEGERRRMVDEVLRYLVIHELGHTLGLSHNMKASQMLSPEECHDPAVTRSRGLLGSIMDYPAVNLAPAGKPEGQFWPTAPGPYDAWAIEYAYSPGLADPAAEAKRLEAILAKSGEPGLAFGNDADDMRLPGRGIDPRVNIDDMSNDAIRYGIERLERIRSLWPGLAKRFDGSEPQELRTAFLVATWQQERALRSMASYVGGVYVDRSAGAVPFRPVPLEEQKRAMAALSEHLFSPRAFAWPADLLVRLQARRRGWDFEKETEDPKLHDRALAIQTEILDALLDPKALRRMSDSSLYGNRYSVATMMNDLTSAIFDGDPKGNPSTIRQNLQVAFAEQLAKIVDRKGESGHDRISKSAAVAALRRIRKLASAPSTEPETQAHRGQLRLVCDRALAVNG